MVCKYCGAEISDNEKACPKCGKSLEKGRRVKDVLHVALFTLAVVAVLAIIYVIAYNIVH